MVPVDVTVPLEHVQVIRSNIEPESVEKCRDVQNEPIWANFRKKAKGIPLGLFFQTPIHFLDTNCIISKTPYKEYLFISLNDIQLIFLYIFIIIRCSSYDRIYKKPKNQPFIT
jgi:hypothetical protein